MRTLEGGQTLNFMATRAIVKTPSLTSGHGSLKRNHYNQNLSRSHQVMLGVLTDLHKQITRPRLARKHNIASEVGPTLQDAFFFPPRSICEASARQHQARCSAQTGRCKLVCASCSAQVAPASWSLQVAPCKLLCANCAPKLLCASCSAQVALKCKLHLATPARGPGRNRTRDPPAREQAREPRDNSRGPARTTKDAKNLEFLHLDHADSRRGLREHR